MSEFKYVKVVYKFQCRYAFRLKLLRVSSDYINFYILYKCRRINYYYLKYYDSYTSCNKLEEASTWYFIFVKGKYRNFESELKVNSLPLFFFAFKDVEFAFTFFFSFFLLDS